MIFKQALFAYFHSMLLQDLNQNPPKSLSVAYINKIKENHNIEHSLSDQEHHLHYAHERLTYKPYPTTAIFL